MKDDERKRIEFVFLSGRTECQTTALGNLANPTNNFERKSSQRFSRRASYAIRKKIQEQEARREQEDERLKKLVSNQESTKRLSSAQKILPATQRLDNLILGTSNDLPLDVEMGGMNAPPVLPRQTTSLRKQSSPVESDLNEQSNPNTNKGLWRTFLDR